MTGPELDILATKIAKRITTPRWLRMRQAVQYAGVGKTEVINVVVEPGRL
jgi:hypothetical protein